LNYLDHLLRLEGDQGASALLSAANETALVDWPDGEFDIDTASDIARAAARAWPERRAWALASLKQSQI
jgi:hypothetical protein